MLKDLLRFAQTTARCAGRILLQHFGRIEHVEYKQIDSIVTEADLRSEEAIRRAVRRTYPEHRVLGEEQGLDGHRAEFTWVVDPLDGTTNFAAGMPLFAVSIALFRKNRPILGVAYDPVRKNCYWAAEHSLAFLNGRPIQVSHRGLSPTTLAGFSSSWSGAGHRRIPSRIISRFKARNLGSSVLQLLAVAGGHMEFTVAEQVRLWDVAAAGFILQQAGGRLTDLHGQPLLPLKHDFEYYLEADLNFLASNALVHREVLRKIIHSKSGDRV